MKFDLLWDSFFAHCTLDTDALEAFVAYENCYMEDSESDQEDASQEEEPSPEEFSESEDLLNPSV